MKYELVCVYNLLTLMTNQFIKIYHGIETRCLLVCHILQFNYLYMLGLESSLYIIYVNKLLYILCQLYRLDETFT